MEKRVNTPTQPASGRADRLVTARVVHRRTITLIAATTVLIRAVALDDQLESRAFRSRLSAALAGSFLGPGTGPASVPIVGARRAIWFT